MKRRFMIDKHLIPKTAPKAIAENIIFWKNYRVTVLGERLFRLERNEDKIFRDQATQSVWFRNADKQDFCVAEKSAELIISTRACKLKLKSNRADCRISFGKNKWQKIDNSGNLKGTYRTLDGCDGDRIFNLKPSPKIELGNGVCSKTGVAVFDDSNSLCLFDDGKISPEKYKGTDEYIFAFENDYRGAIRALYQITGSTPLVPRFALGNWWSRYRKYTHEEYMQVLQRFEDNHVPLTVATIDMDWHYSDTLNEQKQIKEKGKNTEFYGTHYKGLGPDSNGWTGYSWNKELFPDYKKFLKEVKERNLKITLNLHPAQGVRWFEDQYEEMATAMGVDPKSEEWIRFDITNPNFVNNYFSILHRPYEKDGVDFWWIDWQQGTKTLVEGLDPLWLLNHYHYLDQAKNHYSPLLLSRYAGVGSHRYPLGFSGDTRITWNTLKYLPYFTATASNVGYTWWSHDIGGHLDGEKDDEMYVRHIQFGVFSPINRLHGTDTPTLNKEPWLYQNGTGEIAKKWLILRHKLIPFLYSASHFTSVEGQALIEPLYYEWDEENAYKYKNQYLFGGQLLVIPITTKCKADGYARVRAWIPEGVWTDIFTGERYEADKGGVEKTLLRPIDQIPVLKREGGVLPLSLDNGNSVDNPKEMEISVWNGNGEFTLFEDGREKENDDEFITVFKTELVKNKGKAVQTLKIFSSGKSAVVPDGRRFDITFKGIESGKITLKKDGKEMPVNKKYGDFVRFMLDFEAFSEYEIKVEFILPTEMERLIKHAYNVLLRAEGNNDKKHKLFLSLSKADNRTCRSSPSRCCWRLRRPGRSSAAAWRGRCRSRLSRRLSRWRSR